MGALFIGRAPTGPQGRYFKRSYSELAPLIFLLDELCPALSEEAENQRMDISGGYLDAPGAKSLARELRARLENGSVDRYIRNGKDVDPVSEVADELEMTLREDPAGFGPFAREFVDALQRSARPLHRKVVEDFLAFLQTCGGYDIT